MFWAFLFLPRDSEIIQRGSEMVRRGFHTDLEMYFTYRLRLYNRKFDVGDLSKGLIDLKRVLQDHKICIQNPGRHI
ncbi:hypothetical protein PMI13_03059 [Chryseobacterium populi]|uniref:Uncharacterized protein n=1 Tax=Chryseobacterium populi TaxID=1144316 RepID=J3CEK1_9FLAO|nr:hypothetical protein PMI13_03059 [Chryseobacterium populi]